jgi:threonine dehydrogenase-like Zn-dependent dehydrogenase
MRGAILYGPRDLRFEERETPTIVQPTDAIIRISATCVYGSDLWPYRGLNPIKGPTPYGQETRQIIIMPHHTHIGQICRPMFNER